MPRVHKVVDGEHLSAVAKRFGFQDALTIWNDAANEPLRSLRDSPDILLPGDEVQIPDLETKTVKRATGTAYDITVRVQRLDLRARLEDARGGPRKGAKVTIDAGNAPAQRIADSDGVVAVPVPRAIVEATIADEHRTVRLRVGALDPASEPSGWHARLVNLGYLVGSPQETEPQMLQTAIEEFELDNELAVTGKMTGATLAKLVEVHGS